MAGKTTEKYEQSFADFKEATRKILSVAPADIKKQGAASQQNSKRKG